MFLKSPALFAFLPALHLISFSVLSAGNPEPADQLEGTRSDRLRRAGPRRNVSSAASQKRENSLPV